MTPSRTPCPSDTEIALRTEGGLSASAIQAFDEHVDECPECHRLVSELAAGASSSGEEDPRGGSDSEKLAALGRYVLRRPLGIGGMGIVHAAYDPKLDREVAIKLVRAKGDAAEPDARLLREAKALAQLRHPNVVAVHDVGTHASSVYLVMELVPGVTLTRWRSEHHNVGEVLAVFRQAARGIAAAHAAGLVHRDIKPSNILIDESGRPLIADFGLVSGQTGPPPADDTQRSPAPETTPVLTQTGALLGTPRYLAPEVFLGAAGDARSDQFSFCVALYETLYGTSPFAGDTLEALSASVTSGEFREPPRRVRVPARVRAAIRRGLAADPAQRFPDMEALGTALEHRRTTLVVSTVLAVGGVGALAWWMGQPDPCSNADSVAALSSAWTPERRAAVEAGLARAAPSFGPAVWSRAAPRLDTYADGWTASHQALCRAGTPSHDEAAARQAHRGACLEQARQQLGAATALLRDADLEMTTNTYRLLDDLPSIQRCYSSAPPTSLPAAPTLATATIIARLRGRLAEAGAMVSLGKYGRARDLTTVLRRETEATGYPPLTNELNYVASQAFSRTGDAEEALSLSRRVLSGSLEAGQPELAARSAIELIDILGVRLERPAEGLAYVEVAEGLSAKLGRADLASLARLKVGAVHVRTGDYSAAVQAFRTSLQEFSELPGDKNSAADFARLHLVGVLQMLGDLDAAEKELELATRSLRERLAPDHPAITAATTLAAQLRYERGAPEESLALLDDALASHLRVEGPQHPVVAGIRVRLGFVYAQQDQHSQALDQLRTAVAVFSERLGGSAVKTAAARSQLALAIVNSGGDEHEAELEARRALRDIEAALGDHNPRTADPRTALAQVMAALGRPEQSIALYRRAIDDLAKANPSGTTIAAARASLAQLLAEAGETQAARELLEAACPAFDAKSHTRWECDDDLARILWGTESQRARARTLAVAARDGLQNDGHDHEEAVASIDTWLADRTP